MDLAVIQFNKVDALKQEINTQLLLRPVARGTVTSELAWVRNAASGGETIFPLSFFANTAKKRSPYEEVDHTPPEECNFSAPMNEWAPDGEVIPRGTQVADLYGVFNNKLPTIVTQAQNEYEFHTAELLGFGHSATLGPLGIGGGITAYDGLPYFNSGKLVNPNRPWLGTFNNYRTSVKLDRAGLRQAFQFLDGIKGPDGRVMRMPGRLVVVVSNEDQLDAASEELFTKIRARAVGAAGAAGVDNTPNVQGRADLLKLPDLLDFDGGKAWYVFKIVSSEHRPICVNLNEAPQTYIEGLNINEHSRVVRNLIKYGWRGFWGHGYLWPQLAIKFVEP